ncbi:MAG: dephospho-CoA kinase [Brevinematales bacterium]|nr:dephospho-CoA kinase [Brevinematales bacterium]
MVKSLRKRYVVGLVGKAGSGKSTVAKILSEEYHFEVISLDEMGHKALEASREDLVRHFGKEIIGDNNTIQRHILGRVVFGNMEKLLLLNAITHPKIKDLVQQKLAHTSHHTILDGALLYEIGLAPLCDFILMVDAPEPLLLDRLIKQRGWSEDKAQSVLFSQRYLQFLKEQADFIIFNNDGIEKIQRQLAFFVHTLL